MDLRRELRDWLGAHVTPEVVTAGRPPPGQSSTVAGQPTSTSTWGPSGRGSGQRVPDGTAGSLAKLAWSRADQALAELATDLLGLGSLSGEWAYNLASSRSTSIAGGTSEINRNIVAEQGLGLHRG
jgi:alkylation response protein AidB-like acyl-CoA dehydrogenase